MRIVPSGSDVEMIKDTPSEWTKEKYMEVVRLASARVNVRVELEMMLARIVGIQ